MKSALFRTGKFSPLKHIPAKVPVSKGSHYVTGLDFDITFNNQDGVKSVGTLLQYRKQLPELKYLVLVFKVMLSTHGCNKTMNGGLCSFSIILLITSYLQMYYKKLEKLPNPEEHGHALLSDHLINILKLYGLDFKYKKLGISTRNGGSYFKRCDVGFDIAGYGNTYLALENPIDHNVNMGEFARNYDEVVRLFAEKYNQLTSIEKRTEISILKLLFK